MSRNKPFILFGFLVAAIMLLGGIDAMKGVFLIDRHEGDTLHLLQILFRMDSGEWPHKDFMTPIGILAFAPVELFLNRGIGVGQSLIYSQILMGVVLLPMVWWASHSRLKGSLSYLFGLSIVVFILALVHGETFPAVSISMHYNRWAWAISYIAILLAVLPPKGRERPVLDGFIIGACMAALVLLKVTYFVAFFPPILIALVQYKSWRTLAVSAISGLIAAAVVTLIAGFDFWLGYMGDLLEVSSSNVRPQPGEPLNAIISAPRFLGATLTALLGVLLLRQGQKTIAGLLLLLLLPGFIYVTYQNYGNDPQWLMLLAVLLFSQVPEKDAVNSWGWNLCSVTKMAAAAAFALALPSFFNMAFSPFRHLGKKVEDYTALVPQDARSADLMTLKIRFARANAQVALNDSDAGLQKFSKMANRENRTELFGETLPECELKLGYPAWLRTVAADLEQAGLAEGKRIFATDLLSSEWLFSHQLRPLEPGAPWYYGGLPGIDSADYVLVPLCPLAPKVRKIALDELFDRGDIKFTELRRTPLYILLEIQRK